MRLRGGTGFHERSLISYGIFVNRNLNLVRFVRLFLIGRDCQSDCASKCTYIFMSKQTRFFNIITYAQIPLFNNIADVFNGSRSLHLSLRLHQHPFSDFGVSNIECEGESVRLYRLVVAFIAQ